MNSILKLEGSFSQKKNTPGGGSNGLPVGKKVTVDKINDLIQSLRRVISYWETHKWEYNTLVSVYYIDVVAKSNRIQSLLHEYGTSINNTIVGAKFTEETDPRHIITHCVSLDCLKTTLDKLMRCSEVVKLKYNGEISAEDLERCHSNIMGLNSKKEFVSLIKDCYYVASFELPNKSVSENIKGPELVSLYDIGVDIDELKRKIGFDRESFDVLDKTTWQLNPKQYGLLYEKASNLISMSITNIQDIPPVNTQDSQGELILPEPTDEPTIGVIDTLFDNTVPFAKWVTYEQKIKEVPIEDKDKIHGTSVDSLIVAGNILNPLLEDGCGFFKVRHFGVAKEGRNSSITIMKLIENIVEENKDIKVWNLSLGSDFPVSYSQISPESAMLDDIQHNYDVSFVIAGTNNEDRKQSFPPIGSPADSINAIVVNSVQFNERPAEYSRRGPVLCFYNKPDVSAYGGDSIDGIKVYAPTGIKTVRGTSFAAPWISRKLAYLIYIMKLPRELAKAILIDSAAGWSVNSAGLQQLVGYGRVPTRIEDILTTPNDEIKFLLHGKSEKYETYSWNIPIPQSKSKHPFIAKATLCYFPKCFKNQGVDYTSTELDLHFGRIKNNKIVPINNNKQGDSDRGIVCYESDARRKYRKWDNVKHFCEEDKEHNRGKNVYGSGNWGISIRSKERLDKKYGEGLAFGVVITLKEIEGKNRIENFKQACSVFWDVQELSIEAMNKQHIIEEQEVIFD